MRHLHSNHGRLQVSVLKILVACEFSGIVRDHFRSRGHHASSCDLLPSDRPGPHYQGDVMEIIDWDYDLVIAFPPCTHLASSGARWFPEKRADGRQQEGIDFFMKFVEFHEQTGVPVAIENPIGIMSTKYRKPDQIIHPWQFGHPETKATCLWLHGLPKLKPTDIVERREPRVWKMPPSEDRWKKRSLTYQGIASAMSEQWTK